MPPRYVYWTIIVDGQPTAFRSGSLEDIMPTFNRLKEKQPTAELKWFQNGQLWPSRHDAQDFMRARGERGRAKDPRQAGDRDPGPGTRDPETGKPDRAWNAKPEWKTRSSFKPREDRDPGSRTPDPGEKPEWKPKGTFKPKEAGHRAASDDKPEWKTRSSFKPREDRGPGSGIRDPRTNDKPAWVPRDKSTSRPDPGSRTPDPGEKPAWKPKGTFTPHEAGHRPSARDQARSSFKPKSYTPKGDDQGATRSARAQSRGDKLDWKPASASARQAPVSRGDGPNAGFAKSDPDAPKRKWVPKAEYKKSLGIEVKKDSKWRPGGDHVDPKQKYKDAKKAKWGRVKATIRARSSKPRKRSD